jgi:hypothetical protein
MDSKGYFPIQVVYVGSPEKVIVNRPADLKSGEPFKVLQTNVRREK